MLKTTLPVKITHHLGHLTIKTMDLKLTKKEINNFLKIAISAFTIPRMNNSFYIVLKKTKEGYRVLQIDDYKHSFDFIKNETFERASRSGNIVFNTDATVLYKQHLAKKRMRITRCFLYSLPEILLILIAVFLAGLFVLGVMFSVVMFIYSILF